MARALIDHHRRTAIELSRGDKWAKVIPYDQAGTLEIRRLAIREVDRDYLVADPVKVPLVRLAQMYLRSMFDKSPNARAALEEIAMPVIVLNVKEPAIVSRFDNVTDAQAAAGDNPDLRVIDSRETLQKETQEMLAKLSTVFLSTTFKKAKNKEKVAGDVFNELQRRAPPPVDVSQPAAQGAAKADKKTRKPRGEQGSGGHRVGSKKEQAHRLYLEHGKEATNDIVKLGVKMGTARSWLAAWKRAETKKAA